MIRLSRGGDNGMAGMAIAIPGILMFLDPVTHTLSPNPATYFDIVLNDRRHETAKNVYFQSKNVYFTK